MGDRGQAESSRPEANPGIDDPTKAPEILGEMRYIRVARQIREAILDGRYKPGERLLSQHQLAKMYGVAFNTLKQSLDLLEDEGYIVRKLGTGTFIADPDSRKPSILVVDDELPIRKLFAASIAEIGGLTTLVEDGHKAVEWFGREKFDLVFLDLVLPGIDGAETLRRLKEMDANVPVVIVTAYPDSALMDKALSLGPVAMMKKPFSQDDIRAAVRMYRLRRGRRRSRELAGDVVR